ncbi:MAG: NAD(P)/FAD-dependent oxidoreductase [Chloroflexi bacterium]|nr:NAD(P)/FAD-dependent oxidoreductase [Chloroflexota bacterium]
MSDKTPKQQKIAIIGGGIMGVALAYHLSNDERFHVTLFERGSKLGGLAGYIKYDGVRMDRFYHTILSSDLSMQSLIEETGVKQYLHFTATKQGFYDGGKLYPFNTPIDLLKFPPLNIFQRFRLGLQVIYAQFQSDWRKMDDIPVEKWLLRVSGRGVYQKVWKPLLRAKFDSEATDVPATYIWSRLRRMLGTRQGVTSKEMMCYLENGYYTLIEAMANQAQDRGVDIRLDTAIDEIMIEDDRVTGLRTPDGEAHFDVVISTLQSPILLKLIPHAPPQFQELLRKQEYLGVLCPMLIMKRSLIPYYVLNITDETIPFTAVVETTNLIDPKHVNGYHLIYLPKYIPWTHEMASWSDDKVRDEWLVYLKRMFPDFQEDWISEFLVHRARYVEPLRPLGTSDEIPRVRTPVPGLYMGNTAMVYPELANC